MEFDINKVYTAVNANEVKIGSIGFGASTLEDLKKYVDDYRRYTTIVKILSEKSIDRFSTERGFDYNLFYLIEEPKEVKEEYRPYNNIEEFITDYCARFGVYSPSFRYHQIWLDIGGNTHTLILGYGFDTNKIFLGNNNWASLDWIFKHCTYIDGSKCGSKIKGEIND